MNAQEVIAQLAVEIAERANERAILQQALAEQVSRVAELEGQVVGLQAEVAGLKVEIADVKAAANGKASAARQAARS